MPCYELECALADISGLRDTLDSLVDAEKTGGGPVDYLANQLHAHHNAAHDAFCCIFKLDQHREGGAA